MTLLDVFLFGNVLFHSKNFTSTFLQPLSASSEKLLPTIGRQKQLLFPKNA
jgi:hypothetical protein